MEAKFYTALLILGLISTALANDLNFNKFKVGDHDDDDRHHGDHDGDDHHGKRRGDLDKCPPLMTSDELPLKCTAKDRCGTITCSATFEGETVWLSLKIDRSQDPLSAEISLKVPSRNFYWPYTFKSGDKIQVPGFPLKIKGLADADMFLTLTMVKFGRGIAFKLDVILSSEISKDMDVTLLQGKLPVRPKDHDGEEGDHEGYEHPRVSNCGRAYSWFKRQRGTVKAAIVISAILVLSLVITALVYCCKKRRAPKVADTVKVTPPSYDEATTIKTKVPLEKLVNEE